MKNCETFNDLPWHDAVLLELLIDRRNSGEEDKVRMLVRWPDGRISSLVFRDCYQFVSEMNFGVIAEESILRAECTANGVEIQKIRDKWSSIGIDLSELFCCSIQTNSTNSKLNIYALSMSISKV